MKVISIKINRFLVIEKNREILVKEWAIQSKEEILLDEHDEVLANFCFKMHDDCQRNRIKIVHESENQKIIISNKIKRIKVELNSGHSIN